MSTYGTSPSDVVTDAAGNVLPGRELLVYRTKDQSQPVTNLVQNGAPTTRLETDADGRFVFDQPNNFQAPLWARTAGGSWYRLVSDETQDQVGPMVAQFPQLRTDTAQAVTDAAGAQARFGFDITRIRPEFLTAVLPASVNVLQCVAKEPETGNIFLTQTTSAGAETGFTTVIVSRCSPAGVLLDSMTCLNAGHGSTFGVQRIDGVTNIWLTYSHGVSDGPNNQVVRFPYAAGTINYTDTDRLRVLPKFDGVGGEYTLISLDLANDWVAVRWASGTDESYSRRKISEWLAGTDTTYGTVPRQAVPGTFQSFATIDDYLYVYSGTAGGEAHTLRRYSWDTGVADVTQDVTYLGAEITGSAPDGISEPEGANLYRDPITGQPQLIIGKTVGAIPGVSRKYWLFAYTPVGGDGGAGVRGLAATVPTGRPPATLTKIVTTSATTTTTSIPVITAPVPVIAGKLYKLTLHGTLQSTVVNDSIALQLQVDAAVNMTGQFTVPRAVSGYTAEMVGTFTPSATGTVSVTANLWRTSGTGNVSMFASSTQNAFILAECVT